jgi:hypothetical protein
MGHSGCVRHVYDRWLVIENVQEVCAGCNCHEGLAVCLASWQLQQGSQHGVQVLAQNKPCSPSGSKAPIEPWSAVCCHDCGCCRIDTILDCDHLLVLSNGSLVEQGPATQLSTGDGVFAGMVSAAKAAAGKHHH